MEGGEEEVSIQELASNLSTYKEQLEQVRTVSSLLYRIFVSDSSVSEL